MIRQITHLIVIHREGRKELLQVMGKIATKAVVMASQAYAGHSARDVYNIVKIVLAKS